MTARSPYFSLYLPHSQALPILVEVPHASTVVPLQMRDHITLSSAEIARDADIYVDNIVDGVVARGATLLVSHVSRYVVDLNRAEGDVDAEAVCNHPAPRKDQPRGVIWRLSTDGKLVLPAKLSFVDFERRLDTFYRPYHRVLTEEIDRLRNEFGYVIVLAAHSMPSRGRAGHRDYGLRRADIVPGTLAKSSADARLIHAVESHFLSAGLSVKHDDPYRGGFTTAHYGRPAQKTHVIQIEINRDLYVNEDTLEEKPQGLELLRKLTSDLVSVLGAIRL